MAADITHTELERPVPGPFRTQAIVSSVVFTTGAFLAAAVFLAALLVSLPLMLAASLTLDAERRSGRRGWQELEAPAA
ncbi:MAG: hypothetical protein AAF788_04020 [Pseudomonadota bacterium]